MLEDSMCLRLCVSQIQLWVKTVHSGSLFVLQTLTPLQACFAGTILEERVDYSREMTKHKTDPAFVDTHLLSRPL